MQTALRLARYSRPHSCRIRTLTTTANPSAHVVGSSTSPATKTVVIPLSNVEAQWATLTSEEKVTVHEQLEELQKKDWKELSLDEKKAAYYVAFGPHGPRAPTSQPGDNLKILLATAALVGVGTVVASVIRLWAEPPPKTMTKEWEEASNVRAREMNLNPITGISSEGYSGKGFVQSSK